MDNSTTLAFRASTFAVLERIAKENYFDRIQPMLVFAAEMFPEAHPSEYDHMIEEYRNERWAPDRARRTSSGWKNLAFNRKGGTLHVLRAAAAGAQIPLSTYLALVTIRYAEQFPDEFRKRAQRFQKDEKARLEHERAQKIESRLVAPSEPIAVRMDGTPIFSEAKSRKKQ